MLIPRNVIQEIKDRLDILTIVNEYIHNLKKTGKNWVGLCPFHNDRHPSFNVSPDLGIYKCFSCGESGDLIGFIQKIENITFSEAVKILAKKAGIALDFLQEDEGSDNYQKRDELVQFNERIIKLFQHYLLKSREGAEAVGYLKNRGIEGALINEFKIGYAPKGYNRLLKFLNAKGFKEEFLLNTGLFNRSEKGVKTIFFDRVMFPIINHNGECIGFGGRTLLKDGKPKYINTSETVLYKKSYNLYGLNTAKNRIREEKKVYLVEGYLDVISCYKAGLVNAVAPCGTAVTKEQIMLLNRYADEIVLLLDGDEAGKKGMEKALKESVNVFLNKSVILMPEGMDPDDYFKKYTLEDFKELEKYKIDGFDFLVRHKTENIDKKDFKSLMKALNGIFEYIGLWESEVVRNTLVERTAELLNIDKGIIAREFLTQKNKIREYRPENEQHPVKTEAKNLDERTKREIDLLLFLVQHEDSLNLVQTTSLREEHFINETAQDIFKTVILNKNDQLNRNFLDYFDDDNIKSYVNDRLFSHEFNMSEEVKRNNIIDRIIDVMKNYYEIRNKNLSEKIKLGELYKDDDLIKKVQQEKTILNNEILKIKKLQELKK